MNNTLHEHLNKLRIIGRIKEGQRLDTTNGLTIYDSGWLNWIYRKYYHDSKDETTRMLQELFRSIDQSVDQLLVEMKGLEDGELLNQKYEIAITLAEKIKQAIIGVENLSKTYIDYQKTVATLEGIVQDFAVTTYKRLLLHIPEDKYTKTLLGNILYDGIILYLGNDSIIKN
jgi:hypothetical protein